MLEPGHFGCSQFEAPTPGSTLDETEEILDDILFVPFVPTLIKGQLRIQILKNKLIFSRKEGGMQGCRIRPFWLEPEPFFWSGSYFYSFSYSTVNILFLRDPKYEYEVSELMRV